MDATQQTEREAMIKRLVKRFAPIREELLALAIRDGDLRASVPLERDLRDPQRRRPPRGIREGMSASAAARTMSTRSRRPSGDGVHRGRTPLVDTHLRRH